MENFEKLNIVYIPSESMTVQGKKEEIYKKYGKEWHIQELGNGNGNWLLTKPSDLLVNGKSYRNFVLEYYKKSKLTEKLLEEFKNDIKNKKINL